MTVWLFVVPVEGRQAVKRMVRLGKGKHRSFYEQGLYGEVGSAGILDGDRAFELAHFMSASSAPGHPCDSLHSPSGERDS